MSYAPDISSKARAAVRLRPRSLADAVDFGHEDGETAAYGREFLDEFYVEPSRDTRISMLGEEPRLTGDCQMDAYLAAMAEHLARKFDLPVPLWTERPDRFLARPYFPSGLESLKAYCLVNSPVAFRRRMIFVDENPLSRPRQQKVASGE